MAKLTNTGGPVYLYRADPDNPDACHVAAGADVEVPGTATDGGDAWVINGRRWPKSRWAKAADKPAGKPADTKSAPASQSEEEK